MREAIKQRLSSQILALGGRVFDLNEDSSAADKPYAVIVQGPEAFENGWTGFRRNYEIWPYVDAAGGDFGEIDELAEAIVTALDEQAMADSLSGGTFVCRYRGTVESDRLDAGRSAITRGIRFEVAALPLGSLEETAPADGWLAALGAWSAGWLGGGWQVNLSAWPLELTRPSALWRIRSVETKDGGAAFYEVRKRISGHFLGSSGNAEVAAVLEAVGRLQAGTKIALNLAARSYLKVEDIQADLQADGLLTGQVTVSLSRRFSKLPAPSPRMQRVRIYS